MADQDTTPMLQDSVPVNATRTAADSWIGIALSQPLSRVQAVIGVLAGLLTIVGTIVSYSGLTTPAPVLGELVAVVHASRTHKPLLDATVEILTPEDAIVTTLTPQPDGRITRKLKEGRYRIRVTHPILVSETRVVEVHAGQKSELRVALVPRPAPRIVRTVTAEEPTNPMRKFFKNLGL
jgi:hypothetical protein